MADSYHNRRREVYEELTDMKKTGDVDNKLRKESIQAYEEEFAENRWGEDGKIQINPNLITIQRNARQCLGRYEPTGDVVTIDIYKAADTWGEAKNNPVMDTKNDDRIRTEMGELIKRKIRNRIGNCIS